MRYGVRARFLRDRELLGTARGTDDVRAHCLRHLDRGGAGTAGGTEHQHALARFEAADTDPRPPAGESQEIAWFDWDVAVDRADDERLKSLLRALSRRCG